MIIGFPSSKVPRQMQYIDIKKQETNTHPIQEIRFQLEGKSSSLKHRNVYVNPMSDGCETQSYLKVTALHT